MTIKLPINLNDLLRQRTVEGERIEYKTGWNPDPILRTICAFANDFANLGSGYVVIGQDCDANGQPVFPPWAPGGQTRPYKVPASVTAKQKTWHYYIRRYTSTVEAKGDDEQELLSLAAKVPFDDRFCQIAGAADLSQPLMLGFLREVDSALADDAQALPGEALARQMNVAGGASESSMPKNVGLLFFNEAPERFWNFPYAAIEEAVVNAVYHRSYEEREPIEVRISLDELVVLSFPGPDRSIKLADLQAGRAVSRRYRNRRIGEFLKELDLTEGRATGIPKILKVMAANGSPSPMFETDDERTSFVIRLPVHEVARVTSVVGYPCSHHASHHASRSPAGSRGWRDATAGTSSRTGVEKCRLFPQGVPGASHRRRLPGNDLA